jgi:hypothetical protein
MKCQNCSLSKKCVSFEAIQETDKRVATLFLFELHASTIPHPISDRKVKEMKRIAIAKTACREGTSTAYLEQYEDGIPRTILKLPNVQKMKERYKRKYIMDPDQKSDLQKTKTDLFYSDAESKVLKGFVRRFETEDDNNTIILQGEGEGEVCELGKIENLVLNLDATGSVISKGKSTKPFMYHACVFRPGDGNPPLPAISMLAQDNSASTISDMLSMLCKNFK